VFFSFSLVFKFSYILRYNILFHSLKDLNEHAQCIRVRKSYTNTLQRTLAKLASHGH